MPKGWINEEILVRTTRDMEDYTFQRITTAQMLDSNNLAVWNFPEVVPIKPKHNVLDFVHQEGSSVSLKFGQPSIVYDNPDHEE